MSRTATPADVLAGTARWCVVVGDMTEVLPTLPEHSIHAVVTDPPYHLTQASRGGSARKKGTGPFGRHTLGEVKADAKGFCGKTWDGGDIAFRPETWEAVLRVARPGAHLLAFGGDRTYHRLACAVEDAGFDLRGQICYIYGSGFPKSLNVSRDIDRVLGLTPLVVSEGKPVKRMIPGADQNKAGWEKNNGREFIPTVTAAASPEAVEWDGYGTALKPAMEPVCFARAPLSEEGVARNVLVHGTGAINVDGCRIASGETLTGGSGKLWSHYRDGTEENASPRVNEGMGRYPANVLFSHSEGCREVGTRRVATGTHVGRNRDSNADMGGYSGAWKKDASDSSDSTFADGDGTETVPHFICSDDCPIRDLDRQSGETSGGVRPGGGARPGGFVATGAPNGSGAPVGMDYNDSGAASRFFFTSKANSGERPAITNCGCGEHFSTFDTARDRTHMVGPVLTCDTCGQERKITIHATVKPVSICSYLVRLVCRKGGVILDPFAGTGTTGVAALAEGMRVILVEKDPEHARLAIWRMEQADGSQGVAVPVKPAPHATNQNGPLFGGSK